MADLWITGRPVDKFAGLSASWCIGAETVSYQWNHS